MAVCGFFLSGEWLGAFFFCLRYLSQTIFTTRAFNVLRQCLTATAVFTLPVLLLLAFSFSQNCSRPFYFEGD